MSSDPLTVSSRQTPPSKGEGERDECRGNSGDVRAMMLIAVNSYMQQAQIYAELFEAFDPLTSDAIEYLNHYHRVRKIWQELEDGREPGEGNDEILDAWERVHRKACEVYSQLKHENQRLKL